MYVGGTQETQDLAREWVRKKDRKELFTLKPAIWGIGIDLKELGRRIQGVFRARKDGRGCL
jgi:hypothetical protein